MLVKKRIIRDEERNLEEEVVLVTGKLTCPYCGGTISSDAAKKYAALPDEQKIAYCKSCGNKK